MTATARIHPAGFGGWPRSTQVVEFRESLRGVVRTIDHIPPGNDDRLECAIAAENIMAADDAAVSACVLSDLRIAVDVGAQTAEGAWAGVVRSGRVEVDGIPSLAVHSGEFELFPRAAGDGRRMRYRLWLREPSGAAWYLRGTKLVVNEAGGSYLGRIWAETTTLYIVIARIGDEAAEPAPAAPGYAGLVQITVGDFARQLASLHGEPGPSGGLRAVSRLATAFRSVLSEVYLRDMSAPEFAPGIEAAFGDPHDGAAST